MAITKTRKQELVAHYKDLLGCSDGFIVIQSQGLSIKEIDVLRAQIRGAGGKYVVTKNTLFTKALQEIGWPVPDDLLTGPVAVAFGMDNMPAVAKVVLNFTSDREREEKIRVTGGIMNQAILNPKQVETVSKLPTLTDLRAQLLGLIVAPATGLVSVINAASGQIVNVIQAYLDARSNSSEAA